MHRPHPRVLVQAVAGLELRGPRHQLLDQTVESGLLHVEPLRRKALLAAVEETADRDRTRGAFEVRVVEHDAGVAAAELEGHLLQVLRCLRHHPLAGRRGPRERDLANERVLDDRLAGRLPDHDVDDAFRQPALDQGLDARERRKWRRARGLQDDGVAGRDRGSDLVRRQGQRKVPRHDRAAHADRLAHHEAVRGQVRKPDVLTVNLVREVGEPPDVLAEAPGLEPRLEKRLALLLGEDRRDLLDLGQHVLRGLVQDLAALVGRKLRPRRERLGRGLRRSIDIGRAAGGDLVDDLARGGIADLVRLAGRGLCPLAFDDHRRHAAPP